jgi:hypothetical protein
MRRNTHLFYGVNPEREITMLGTQVAGRKRLRVISLFVILGFLTTALVVWAGAGLSRKIIAEHQAALVGSTMRQTFLPEQQTCCRLAQHVASAILSRNSIDRITVPVPTGLGNGLELDWVSPWVVLA